MMLLKGFRFGYSKSVGKEVNIKGNGNTIAEGNIHTTTNIIMQGGVGDQKKIPVQDFTTLQVLILNSLFADYKLSGNGLVSTSIEDLSASHPEHEDREIWESVEALKDLSFVEPFAHGYRISTLGRNVLRQFSSKV